MGPLSLIHTISVFSAMPSSFRVSSSCFMCALWAAISDACALALSTYLSLW